MTDDLFRLFDEVRLLEHRLVRTVDALHVDLDVTVPGRAVLEFLGRSGPASVPEIARARLVTRQHIQTIVDTLDTSGHVERSANPAHRRSPHIGLTDSGAALIALMHEREHELVRRRLNGIDPAAVAAAAQLLAEVRETLGEEEDL